MQEDEELITLKEACRLLVRLSCRHVIIVGRRRPFPQTRYPSPNISRVSKRKVLELRDRLVTENN